jgi:hypothetical protein
MCRLYLALSLGIVALGLVHIIATPRLFTHLTPDAVWFANGGLSIVLTGALNLLRREYGQSAFGLRIVCVIANIVMATFALLAGFVTRASVFQFAMVIGLLGGAAVLSLLPGAQKHVPDGTSEPFS